MRNSFISLIILLIVNFIFSAASLSLVEETAANLQTISIQSRTYESSTSTVVNTSDKSYCLPDGDWPRTRKNSVASLSCGDPQYFYGSMTRICPNKNYPVWEDAIDGCKLYSCDSTASSGQFFPTTAVHNYHVIVNEQTNKQYVKYCNDKHEWENTEVIDSANACNSENYENHFYPTTEKGKSRKVSCGVGSFGFITRECTSNGWGRVIANECSLSNSHIIVDIAQDAEYSQNVLIAVTCSNTLCKLDHSKISLTSGCAIQDSYSGSSISADYAVMISRYNLVLDFTLLEGAIVDEHNDVIPVDITYPYTVHVPYSNKGFIEEDFSGDLDHIGSGSVEYVPCTSSDCFDAIRIVDEPLYVGDKFYDSKHSNKFLGAEGGEVSLMLWFKLDNESSQIIAGIHNDDNEEEFSEDDFYIFVDEFGIVHIHTGINDQCEVTNFTPEVDEWYHIGFSYFSDINQGTTKKYIINGQVFSCPHTSTYSPMVGRDVQIGDGHGISVQDLILYRTAVADDIIKARFNLNNKKPFIYLNSLTSTQDYKVILEFTFSEPVSIAKNYKYQIFDSEKNRHLDIDWDVSDPEKYYCTITFPRQNYETCPSVILKLKNGFVTSNADSKKKSGMEKFLVTYQCQGSIIVPPAATRPYISSRNPEPGNIEENQSIKLYWDQEVVCGQNFVIKYRENDSFFGNLPEDAYTVYSNYVEIYPPFGLLYGRSVYFIIPEGVCTDASGTKDSQLYQTIEHKYTIQQTTTPFTGSLSCFGEGGQSISQFIITCNLTYDRPVSFSSPLSKIRISGGKMSTPFTFNNYILFYVYPTFVTPTVAPLEVTPISVSYTITISSGIAVDYGKIPTSSSELVKTITSQYHPILRYYQFNQNGDNYIENNKNCIVPISPVTSWVPNFDNEIKAYEFHEDKTSFICGNNNDVAFLAPVPTAALTIQFWYFVDDANSNAIFVNRLLSNGKTDYKVYLKEQKLCIQTANTGSYILCASNSFEISMWHQVTVILESKDYFTKVDLYVDGQYNLNSEVILDKSYGTESGNPLYVGSCNNFRLSSLIFYAYALPESEIKSNFEKYARPIVSFKEFELPVCGSFVLPVTTNKMTEGLDLDDFIINPSDAISMSIETSATKTLYNVYITPLVNSLVTLQIQDGAVYSLYNKPSYASDIIQFDVNVCVAAAPTLKWMDQIPCVRNYNKFEIDFSTNDYPINFNLFSAQNGFIRELTVSGRKVSGYFILNYNTPLDTLGHVYYANNVCGDSNKEVCDWTVSFAHQFTGIYASDYTDDTLNTKLYLQLNYDAILDNGVVIGATVRCDEQLIFGYRRVESSGNKKGYFCLFAPANSGNQPAITCYADNQSMGNRRPQYVPIRSNTCDDTDFISIWISVKENELKAGRGDYETDNYLSVNIHRYDYFDDNSEYTIVYHTSDDHNTFFMEDIFVNDYVYSDADDGSDNTFKPDHDHDNDHDDDDDFKKHCLRNTMSLDTSVYPLEGTVRFPYRLSYYHDLTSSSFKCTNCVVSNIRVESACRKVYKFDVTIVNKLKDYEVKLYSNDACEDKKHNRHCNCGASVSGNLNSETIDVITAELTWNESKNTNTLPVYITLTFNREYSAKFTDFIIENGGKIVHFEPTHNGGVIAVIPESINQVSAVPNLKNYITCRAKSHIIVEGELYSPATSIVIDTSLPNGVAMNYDGVTDTIYSENWKGYEMGFIGFTYKNKGYGPVDIELSPAPETISSIYRIHLDNSITGRYLLQRRTTLKNWESIVDFTGVKTTGNENTYKVTYINHELTVSVLKGSNYAEDTILLSYSCNSFEPLYYGFMINQQTVSIYDVENLVVLGENWQYLDITTSNLNGIEDFPVVITVNSDIPVSTDKWVTFNGYMASGKVSNQFFFYPTSQDGKSSFYLKSRIENEQNIITRTSSVYQVTFASRINTIVMPLQNSEEYPITSELFAFAEQNSLTLPLYIKTETENIQRIKLYQNTCTMSHSYFVINVCGVPSIQYYYLNAQVASKTGGHSVNCLAGASVKLFVSYDNDSKQTSVLLNYSDNSQTYKIELSYVDAIPLTGYAFGTSSTYSTISLDRPFTGVYCINNDNVYSEFEVIDSLTIDQCQQKCGAHHEFFGLTNGNKCICYPNMAYIHGERILNDQCNRVCIGNTNERCGGQNAISIHSTRYVIYDMNQYSFDRLFTKTDSLQYSYYLGYDELTISHDKSDIYTFENSPMFSMNVPTSYTLSSQFYLPVIATTQRVGYVVYENDRSDISSVCYIFFNPNTQHYKFANSVSDSNGKGINITPRQDVTSLTGWIRMTRTEDGVFKCAYRLYDDTLWSDNLVDDTNTDKIGKHLGFFSQIESGYTITWSKFVFTSDFEKAHVYASHNFKNEVNTNKHTLRLTFSENFQVYTDTKFNFRNLVLEDVVPLSYNTYDLYLVNYMPGFYSFNVPEDVSDDLSQQGNYPLNYGCVGDSDNSSSYSPESIKVVLTNKGLSTLHEQYIEVEVVFSKAILNLDVSKFIVSNLEINDEFNVIVNDYTVLIYVQFKDLGTATIYLPSQSVFDANKYTNTVSNTLVLPNNYYCPAYTSTENGVTTSWPKTFINKKSSRKCSTEYDGYVYKKCNSNGQWENEDNSECQIKKCSATTEGNYQWPETAIQQTATLSCPYGYDGSVTRPCLFESNKAKWGTVNKNCVEQPVITYDTLDINIHDETMKNIVYASSVMGSVYAFVPELPIGFEYSVNPFTISGTAMNVIQTTHTAKIVNGNSVTTVNILIDIAAKCVYNGQLYDVDTVLDFSCSETQTGSIKKQCTQNSCGYLSWKEISNTCSDIQCAAEVDSQYHASWDATTIGNQISVSCPNGLEGTLTRLCNNDQSWGSISGSCTTPQCETNTDNKWGITWEATDINGVISKECPNKAGYLTRTCGPNKEWKAVVGTCVRAYCDADIDSEHGINWPQTSIGQVVVHECPEGQSGQLTRQCSTNGEWNSVSGVCTEGMEQCPAFSFDITDTVELSFPNTPVGSTAHIPCGSGSVDMDCQSNGNWDQGSMSFNCGACPDGQQRVDIFGIFFYCVPCEAGHACHNCDANPESCVPVVPCTDNTYAPGGNSECLTCEGHIISNKYGQVGCVVCNSNEVYINGQCQPLKGCAAETLDGHMWPSVNVGDVASLPCGSGYISGEMKRNCFDDNDASTELGIWGSVNMDNCIKVPGEPGHKYVQFFIEYHKVPQNIYDQDEAHYDNVRAFVQTMAYQLSYLHTIDAGEGIKTDSISGESHVFTRLNLTVGVQQNNDIDTFVRSNLNTQVKNIRTMDDLTYHYDYYIMIQDEAPVYQFTAYCYNEEYDKKVTVGDYLYTPCQNPATTTDITMVGEVASLCDFDYQLGVAYFRQPIYKGCKPIYPTVANHVFIDMFYQIKYTVASNYYCSAITKFFKRYLQWADAVVFDYDVHTFKNVTIDGHIATQFTVRFETNMENTLKLKEHLQHLGDQLYDLVFTNIPSVLSPNVDIIMPLDETTNITYFTQDKNGNRRLTSYTSSSIRL